VNYSPVIFSFLPLSTSKASRQQPTDMDIEKRLRRGAVGFGIQCSGAASRQELIEPIRK
jgi:hypothetical protein